MSDNIKSLTKEELVKLLEKKEEEIHYLSENINNKEIEISNLKEEHKKELETRLNELASAKEKDLELNINIAHNKINELEQNLARRENEVHESVNLLNSIVTCVTSFSDIVSYANGEVIKKVTKKEI